MHASTFILLLEVEQEGDFRFDLIVECLLGLEGADLDALLSDLLEKTICGRR